MSLDLIAAGIGYVFIAFVGLLITGVSIAFVMAALIVGIKEILNGLFPKKK